LSSKLEGFNNIYSRRGSAIKFDSIAKKSKKNWIENIELLDPTLLLEEYKNKTPIINIKKDRIQEAQEKLDSNTTKGKIGKSTEYFINNVRSKSGKDRCLSRITYSQYLPSNFDSNLELRYAITRMKATNNTSQEHEISCNFPISNHINDNTNNNCRSSLDYYSTCDGSISLDSEDELYNINMSDKIFNSPPSSALSKQPILSAKKLVDKLKFINYNNMNKSDLQNEQTKYEITKQKNKQTNSSVNYTDFYVLDNTYESKATDLDKNISEKILKKREALGKKNVFFTNKSDMDRGDRINNDEIVDKLNKQKTNNSSNSIHQTINDSKNSFYSNRNERVKNVNNSNFSARSKITSYLHTNDGNLKLNYQSETREYLFLMNHVLIYFKINIKTREDE
jgi:hypothetical protein